MSDHREAHENEPEAVELTFAFVDLAGFTALTEAHGDREAFATIHAFRERSRASIGDDHLVKTIGDALMFAFPDPDTALNALCRILEAELSDLHHNLLPRAGAHHGTAIAEQGDYVGAAVNLASRVTGFARGGQIVTTGAVASVARSQGRVVSQLGPTALRNIAQPTDLWEIHIASTGAPSEFDPVCAMRVPTEGPTTVTLRFDDQLARFCSLDCASRFAAAPHDFIHRLPGGDRQM